MQTWPIAGPDARRGSTRRWTTPACATRCGRRVKAGLGATAIALVLGTLAAFAVARYRFFGREAISFLVVLPIALPGIVTGMALNATFRRCSSRSASGSGCSRSIVGHATFCIVVVYNNVVARLRRTSTLVRGGVRRPRRRDRGRRSAT